MPVRESDHEIRVAPSIRERLFDEAPRQPGDVMPTRAESVRQFRAWVERDLEHLLNTRNPFADLAPEFTEVRQSVIAYGLPDFSAVNIKSPTDQDRLRQAIKAAIECFEPRLTNVVAELVPAAENDKTLRLRVHARLLLQPTPERVSFDIVKPVQSSRYEVKELA